MPDRQFIHSEADVSSVLLYSIDHGLKVILDEPQQDAKPNVLSRDEAAKATEGIAFVFRPEWVFGPFHLKAIPGGYYKGKYSVQPRTNFAHITLYFQGERTDRGRRQLGSASAACHPDWLAMPEKTVEPTPPDVKVWFKRIADHLSSGVVIKAGVHKYHVTKGVMNDPGAAKCLPPFVFIPWGEEVLHYPDKNSS